MKPPLRPVLAALFLQACASRSATEPPDPLHPIRAALNGPNPKLALENDDHLLKTAKFRTDDPELFRIFAARRLRHSGDMVADRGRLQELAQYSGFSSPIELLSFIKEIDAEAAVRSATRFQTTSTALYWAALDHLKLAPPMHWAGLAALAKNGATPTNLAQLVRYRLEASILLFEVAWLESSRGSPEGEYVEHVVTPLRLVDSFDEWRAVQTEWGAVLDRLASPGQPVQFPDNLWLEKVARSLLSG